MRAGWWFPPDGSPPSAYFKRFRVILQRLVIFFKRFEGFAYVVECARRGYIF